MTDTNNDTISDLRTLLLAAVGAADLALATLAELVANLRERAGEATAGASTRVDETRGRLNKLQEDLPREFGELRERFSGDELRKAATGYLEAATSRCNSLAQRGEAAVERLRGQSAFKRNVA